VKAGEGRWNADDVKLAQKMVRRMAAFVKTHDPNSSGEQPPWPAWTSQNRQYLEIGDRMQPWPFKDDAIMGLYRKQFGR
jgi:carboxylesterase type B